MNSMHLHPYNSTACCNPWQQLCSLQPQRISLLAEEPVQASERCHQPSVNPRPTHMTCTCLTCALAARLAPWPSQQHATVHLYSTSREQPAELWRPRCMPNFGPKFRRSAPSQQWCMSLSSEQPLNVDSSPLLALMVATCWHKGAP